MNVEWNKRRNDNLLMDVTSEVGARGGSDLSERSTGLNWLPVVIFSWLFPKQEEEKLHWNNGLKGCCVVVVMDEVEVVPV
jgi:hypothetical protein